MKRFSLLTLIALVMFASASFAQQWINTVVSLTGTVADEVTRKPISVQIQVIDSKNNKLQKVNSNSKDGYYYITGLKPDQKYKLVITSINFFKEEMTIMVPATDKYLEISKDILVKPLVEEIRVPILVSPFEVNKSKIRFGADVYLEDFVSSLKLNPTVKFEIMSFPDADKGIEANKSLTDSRAEALKEYFVSKGIKAERISILGSAVVDPKNPPPSGKTAKGKRYIGPTYIIIKSF